MKNKSLTTTVILWAVLSISVNAQLAGTYKTITLDGSLADWSNPADVLYDTTEIGAGLPAASSYDDIYVANDAANLYIGLDTSGAGGGDVNNTWTRNVYIDTDNNAGTGYTSTWFSHGYDRLVQYGASGSSYSVFEFNGASQSTWSWNWLGLISYAFSNDVAELSVPLSSLGVAATDPIVMEVNATGSGVTTETWASAPESAAETYTVATAPPSGGTNFTYTAATGPVFNPERGLYYTGPLESWTDFANIRAQGVSLCYANLSLDNFRSNNISTARLQEIENAFADMRSAGLKSILRITYDNNPAGLDTTLAWMETHLQQLQPILDDNSELIAFVQAGMIGAWGEWHSSANGHDTPTGRAAVYDLLCAYMPTNKFIQIRTPGFVNELENIDTDPLDDSTAFSGSSHARIAHHNDAWISSETDMGTYPSDSTAREALKGQIEHHTKYAPWGGESAALYGPYAQYAYVLAEAERFHATYLNADYNPDVIAELTSNGSWDVIKEKLGHRFQLVSAILPESLVAGEEFEFEIRLQNSGWAPLYNARPVILRILSGSNVLLEIELPTDPRFWRPEAGVVVLSGSAYSFVTIASEHLGFALWLPDAEPELQGNPDYSVHFANVDVWDATRGHNLLKTPVSEPVVVPDVVTLDGSLSDWDTGNAFYTNAEISIGSPNNSSYSDVYLTNGAANLYIALDTKNSGGGDIANSWTHSIYIDTDMDAGTGYNAGWMSHGYDRLVQYGAGGSLYTVFEFTGISQGDSTRSAIGAISYAFNDDKIELSIPLSLLEISGDSAVVELNVAGSGVSTPTWAHKTESSAKTYTLDNVGSTTLANQSIGYNPATANIEMDWHGPSNSVIDIDFSADLVTWELLGRGISDGSGDFIFVDHPPTSEQKRFYRAKK